jgi:murein DD-endopeptidase MepM/ murein hydrolase activator NlpD
MNVVKVGQKVRRGEVISYVGSTGSSTGPHVHYEIWKNGKHVNPEDYIKGRV